MRTAFVVAASFVALASAAALRAQQYASVGEKVPDVTFPQFLNGDGRQQLSDFFGQPVVIDRWGTRCAPCIGTAVPNAIRHDHEFAQQGLVTILVESQGSNPQQLERFLWERFADNECFSCVGTHVPIPPSSGIPHCGVIGVDGTLLWAGNPAAFPKQVEDLVEQELAKVKKGWGDSADARKVRAQLYGKGDIAAAAALVAAMPEGNEKPVLQQEVERRYASQKRAVETLQQRGEWLAAEAAAQRLQGAVAGHATWTGEVATLVAAFATDGAKAELDADKKLAKVMKVMRQGKLDTAPKALQKLADKASGTAAAQRATRLLAALQSAPSAGD